MKAYLFVLVAIVALSYVDHKRFHNRNMDMGEQAFTYGCYVQAKHLCGKIKDDFNRSDCYDDAYVNCPKWGVSFREGLEAAGK